MPLTVLNVSYPLALVSPRTAGGAEQVLATLDKGIVEAGHRSLVVAPAGSRCNGLLIPARIPTGVLDENAKRNARRTFKDLIHRTLEEYPVDVVHMHGLDFHEYVPDRNISIIVTLHLPLSWYEAAALRSSGHRVCLICVSNTQASTARSGVRIHRVITNGVEIQNCFLSRRKSNYAVVISRICPEKGIHLAIEAAERAGIELRIAGSVFEYSEHRDYFESMIRPRLSGRVRFLGPVGGARKINLLSGARCLLISSLAPETSSLVAMEAMAAGTPVISFSSGALPEIVKHGRTGFLVSSTEEMSEAIAEANSILPKICREEAERRFSAAKMVDAYLDLYTSVLKSASVARQAA
ncbi:MAG TPA: glycosyltransferase [Terriglobales bacterium]|nr:glycosyltransferase [Terriglobales bacterium]